MSAAPSRRLPVINLAATVLPSPRLGRGGQRSATVDQRRVGKAEGAAIRAEADAAWDGLDESERPTTRGDCLPGGRNCARPCPWVSCNHHLYLDVDESTGSLKVNFPDLEPWELADTCALDVADRAADEHVTATLARVGVAMNLTRERVRQIVERSLAQVRTGSERAALIEAMEYA